MIASESISDALSKVRTNSPLVHNITNYVVMNNTANALLSLGASPVMAHATQEVEDMVGIASSLVINMGTLSEKWVDAMILAGKKATERKIPLVFDPVGVGATPYRTQVAQQILKQCKPTIIRGNASEIMALYNSNEKTKGVDSLAKSDDALESAKQLSKAIKAIVCISGDTDYITDGERVAKISNGNPMMAKVTGMGCSATAVVAAFAAVENDQFLATGYAMAVMGITGELAVKISKGPGSLQMNFLDILYALDKKQIQETFIQE